SVHFSIVNNIRKVLALYEVKCPLYRLIQIKKPPSNGGMPSLLRIGLESQEKILLEDEKKNIENLY
ncbi:hypothetical protein KJ633_04525, partial [bacterium]|nr:hypothetical protein [bacterium]